METDSSSSVHVNEDLVKEILLKLPTKSVVRFKGLSKSWFSVISDPQFARRHFDAAVAPTYKLLNLANDSEAYCVDIESALYDDSRHARSNVTVPLGFDRYENCLTVAGSCRGFLLLQYLFHDFVLWNPSTGIHKAIYNDDWSQQHLHGMGYDPVDDDIVVVTVTLGINEGDNSLVRYFCLRKYCWTSVECVLPYTEHKFELELGRGQFWNGAIYWIVNSADKLRSVVIAFDVREKRISEILLPNHLAILPKGSDIYYLKVMREYLLLCLVVRNYISLIEIWSMKQCKQETFWTKMFASSSKFGRFCNLIFPICFTENGEILALGDNNRFVKINEKGKLIHGKQHNVLDFLSCGLYKESFLPFPGDSEENLSEDEQQIDVST